MRADYMITSSPSAIKNAPVRRVKARLKDSDVKRAKITGEMYRLSDGGGIYLEVSAVGGKVWYLSYIKADGKRSRKSLGNAELMSVEQARLSAFVLKRQVMQEKLHPDEAAIKAKAQAAAAKVAADETEKLKLSTFAACAERYMAAHEAGWSETHRERCVMLLRNYLLPAFGPRQIKQITAPDLVEFMDRIIASGKVPTGRKAFQLFGSIVKDAMLTGFADQNVTLAFAGSKRLGAHTVKHFAAITDPEQLGALLRAAEGYSGEIVKIAMLVTAHTFQRSGDIRAMRWSDINFDKALWTFDVSKTKQSHIVPLSVQVVALLKRQRELCHADSPYVFHCFKSRTRPLSENAVRSMLRAMGYGNDQVTPHGFRATARTILDEVLLERIDLIENQLAHAVRDPLGRAYNRTSHLPERIAMMQRWSDYLDSLRDAGVVNKKRDEIQMEFSL